MYPLVRLSGDPQCALSGAPDKAHARRKFHEAHIAQGKKRKAGKAKGDLTITFRLTLSSTVSQPLLRADTVFFAVLDDVRVGDRRGQFWLQSDGNSADGFAVFLPEGGSVNELLFYPVDVAAAAGGEVTLGLPVEHFAFDADAGEGSDFTVWASAQRRVGNSVVANDVSAKRVVRFLKDS